MNVEHTQNVDHRYLNGSCLQSMYSFALFSISAIAVELRAAELKMTDMILVGVHRPSRSTLSLSLARIDARHRLSLARNDSFRATARSSDRSTPRARHRLPRTPRATI